VKVYFAGVNMYQFPKILWDAGARHIMLNYRDVGAFERKNTFEKLLKHLSEYEFEMYLDSGAWPAFARNTPIDVKDYAEFLHKYSHHFKEYFNLDVIGDFDATWDNQDYLEGEGLEPVPVFQYGTPLEVLRIVVRKYSFIGLGGMVPVPRKQLRQWLDYVFYDKEGSLRFPDIRFHGLGLTTANLLQEFPFDSVDSSTWLVAKRFGEIIVDGKRVKSDSASLDQTIKWYLKMQEEISAKQSKESRVYQLRIT